MAELTWQALNDSVQQQFLAATGVDASVAWNDPENFKRHGEGTDPLLDAAATYYTLPGQSGQWRFETQTQEFMQPLTAAEYQAEGRYGSYRRIKQGAGGTIDFGKDYRAQSHSTGWFFDHLDTIVLAAIGAMTGGAIAGAGGAGGAGVGETAGWVSAEGGAGYAGGLGVEAGALAGSTGEVAGWVSAEGGTGYAGGAAVDATAPGIGSTLLNKAGSLLVDKATAWGLAQAGGAITAGVDRATSETRDQANPGGGYGGGPGAEQTPGSQQTPTNQQGKLVTGGIMIATALMMLILSKAGV